LIDTRKQRLYNLICLGPNENKIISQVIGYEIPRLEYIRFMNTTMKGQYQGDLRCEHVHLASGEKIITDAPTDNQGKGMAFSPTDLLCTALAACLTTIMGITARSKSIAFENVHTAIEKRMGTEPRRVIGIAIIVSMSGKDLDHKSRQILEHAALTCPVAKSLHPDIEQDIRFEYTE
jgi:putative redox protein